MMLRQYVPDQVGCSDRSCIYQDNTGQMVTNGGCQCIKELQRTPEGWKAVRTIIFLQREMQGLNMDQLVAYRKPEADGKDCNAPGLCVCGGDTQRVRQTCYYYTGEDK
jgi:hypothetical protein